MRGSRSCGLALAAAVLAVQAAPARADDLDLDLGKPKETAAPATSPAPSSANDLPELSYLWDGGAVPFLWGALAGRLMLDTYGSPPESPRMFSAGEGGASLHDWEIPGWGVSALGGVSMAAMIGSGDDSRWYHVKGLSESLATGCLVTGSLKLMFGRHRPSWVEGDPEGQRRSFPSGHSTQAFAIATYSILYLRGHVFDGYRGKQAITGLELATYTGIGLAAGALAGERVLHHRHHLTDVVVGGLLGAASSTVFYLYQEHRYRNRKHRAFESNLTVLPTVSSDAILLNVGFGW